VVIVVLESTQATTLRAFHARSENMRHRRWTMTASLVLLVLIRIIRPRPQLALLVTLGHTLSSCLLIASIVIEVNTVQVDPVLVLCVSADLLPQHLNHQVAQLVLWERLLLKLLRGIARHVQRALTRDLQASLLV
jgi:hypothetical protein